MRYEPSGIDGYVKLWHRHPNFLCRIEGMRPQRIHHLQFRLRITGNEEYLPATETGTLITVQHSDRAQPTGTPDDTCSPQRFVLTTTVDYVDL